MIFMSKYHINLEWRLYICGVLMELVAAIICKILVDFGIGYTKLKKH